MSRVALSAAQVLALAPDESSAKAAKGLLSPAKWPLLGASDEAVWGECQGSGSKPYQTQVDVSDGGAHFRCTCPSRKFPCKHGLALLLLQAQDGARFSAPRPAWVDEWLASRRQRAERKEAKAAAQEVAQAAEATDPESVARQAEREQQRLRQRWQRMQAGAVEMERWLHDLMRQGLASLSDRDAAQDQAQTLAARMVDAQAPGLGQRLVAAMAGVGQGRDWPERLLARLGGLQLLIDAVRRVESLPPALVAEVRQAAGWPIERETVLAEGEAVEDRWRVAGVLTRERQGLVERRVWLQGATCGRWALLLDFAHGGQGLGVIGWPGQRWQATLRFYPGVAPLRALLATPPQSPTQESGAPPEAPADPWPALAQAMAGNPWAAGWPLTLASARLAPPAAEGGQGGWALQTGDGRAVPLRLVERDAWAWLTQTAGAPATVFGEWDGEALHPLAAWSARGDWVAMSWADDE